MLLLAEFKFNVKLSVVVKVHVKLMDKMMAERGESMYIIAGLGNPGRKYEGTRHNVGFHTIDLLAHRNNIKVNKLKHKALYGEGMIDGKKIILAKPQTYMNLSGQSLFDMVQYYKVSSENIIVIYDDIDIPLGSIRIRPKGSAGTHNGMRSIIYQLQTDCFPRVRIGVGRPQNENIELADFVLSGFSKDELPHIKDAIERAASAAEIIVTKGVNEAMNKHNG